MKTTHVTILGDKWKFCLCTPTEYSTFDTDDNSEAIAYLEDKKVMIKDLSKDTLTHELTHCYYSYLCLSSTTSITPRDNEEIAAEFNAKYGDLIAKHCKTIYNKLKG
jgi:hypothetical protein